MDVKDGGAVCAEMAWDGWCGRDRDLMTTWSGTTWMDGTAREGAAWPDGVGVDLRGPGEDTEGRAVKMAIACGDRDEGRMISAGIWSCVHR